MNTVICMKWGDKFGADYVNRLYAMVQANLTLPHRFVCFTDKSEGLADGIDVQPLPELPLDAALPERGWRKLTVFQPDLAKLEGRVLFLDLDVILLGNIDAFFAEEGDFLIIKDWDFPEGIIGNSSVFRFEAGQHSEVLSYFMENGDAVRQAHRNEQAYLSHKVHESGRLRYWPDAWCVSFKRHCLHPFPLNYFKEPKLPTDAKILIFHGRPTPVQAFNGFVGKLGFRYVKPTRWLARFWQPVADEEG